VGDRTHQVRIEMPYGNYHLLTLYVKTLILMIIIVICMIWQEKKSCTHVLELYRQQVVCVGNLPTVHHTKEKAMGGA